MYKSNKILKLIINNILVSLVFISVSFVSVTYINRKIEHITDSIVLKHKLESELNKKTELFTTIENDVKIIGNNEIIINNAFIPSNDISEFISSLDTISTNKKITQTYHFETPTPSTISGLFPLSTISYTNNISTDIIGFSDYLNIVENLHYFTKIDGISIQSQDKLGWDKPSIINMKETLLTKTIE